MIVPYFGFQTITGVQNHGVAGQLILRASRSGKQLKSDHCRHNRVVEQRRTR